MLLSLLKDLVRVPFTARRPRAEVPASRFSDQEALSRKVAYNVEMRRERYLDWPGFVHLETIALCNAACDFCPYPSLERKGVRMSDALIEKVIGDLCDIPREVNFQLAPYKVSEPFLEPRLFDILDTVNARLPNAYVSIITNGTALTERKIEQLRAVRNVAYLNVSLNFDDAERYEKVMKLRFARTLRRLDALHQSKQRGDLPFPVRLTRVSENALSDTRFLGWAQTTYPAFESLIVHRNDWIGEIPGDAEASEVPDVPCHRWFDMSITATGKVAMCCMDGEAKYPKGDVNTHHVLEIYNQPRLRRMREQLFSRRQAGDPCDRCTYLNY
jgi:MoaA/NifB/PqqE/SkfB family radical SAM enzyme